MWKQVSVIRGINTDLLCAYTFALVRKRAGESQTLNSDTVWSSFHNLSGAAGQGRVRWLLSAVAMQTADRRVDCTTGDRRDRITEEHSICHTFRDCFSLGLCRSCMLEKHEYETILLPVIGSQREPVSPTLSAEFPHKALSSHPRQSHSGPAAVSGTGASWVVPSSGRCLYRRCAEYLDPTTPQVSGCRWCTGMVKSHF